MAYEICKRCGSMFEQNKRKYCRDCFEKNQREYGLIIKHMKNNPQATVLDIITQTGVSLKTINCLVEDGDVSYVENKLAVENTDLVEGKDSKKDKFHSRYRR